MNKEAKYGLTIENISQYKSIYKESYCDVFTMPAKQEEKNWLSSCNDFSCNNQKNKYVNLLSKNIDVLKKVFIKVNAIENTNLRRNVVEFVSCFVLLLNQKEEITNHLTPLNITTEEDSVFLEWVFRDFRVGFTIMEEENDSMWFFISNKNLREKAYSENLPRSEYQSVIGSVLRCVLENT